VAMVMDVVMDVVMAITMVATVRMATVHMVILVMDGVLPMVMPL